MIKVAVGLSGGVDSAVSVLLLQQAGYEPIGVFLRMHQASEEAEAARKAAEELGIEFYERDMRAQFEQYVLRPFAELYKRGETPNPCLLCNPAVKFRGLLEAADALGCEKIATGHYAAVGELEGKHLIRRLPDSAKDQSYMLYGLGEEVLSRLILPLGAWSDKAQIRALAEEKGLSNAKKKDSLDLCFLQPEDSHAAFIETYTGSAPEAGKIKDLAGNILGMHAGICHYTVGQRRGLGVASDQRLYVCALDPLENTVTLGPKSSVEAQEVRIKDLILHLPLRQGTTAKIRYRDRDTAVCVELSGKDRAVLHFDSPKSAAAPGQSAVIYWQDWVLGGGIIEKFDQNDKNI
ncbi:MAG: tRNA 2-thiouridine(34) synthase MnmA [Clostridia bacterium]|nr:tRNA 2-thiouridine(34) synthase MnmA [Clostridia bacterium]MBR4086894.1 tRNA 2-thiouridine(34) synthase MnmA [Clostridia bacterium]